MTAGSFFLTVNVLDSRPINSTLINSAVFKQFQDVRCIHVARFLLRIILIKPSHAPVAGCNENQGKLQQ